MSVTVDPILRNFDYLDMPQPQQNVARLFQQLAINLNTVLPDGSEKKVAIHRLLESRNAAIASVIEREAA